MKLHQVGILHKDLHTGNIIYKNGVLTLIDWGSATFFEKETPEIQKEKKEDISEIEREIHWCRWQAGKQPEPTLLNNATELFPPNIAAALDLKPKNKHPSIGLAPPLARHDHENRHRHHLPRPAAEHPLLRTNGSHHTRANPGTE